MLTIFTAPKSFYGHIGVIQTNAIRSWLLLCPECEIILFGGEEGIAEVATIIQFSSYLILGGYQYKPICKIVNTNFANIFANELFTTINDKVVLNSTT